MFDTVLVLLLVVAVFCVLSLSVISELFCSTNEDVSEDTKEARLSLSLFFFFPQPDKAHTANNEHRVKQSETIKNFLFIKVTTAFQDYNKILSHIKKFVNNTRDGCKCALNLR